jgi:hypothetical protein
MICKCGETIVLPDNSGGVTCSCGRRITIVAIGNVIVVELDEDVVLDRIRLLEQKVSALSVSLLDLAQTVHSK